MAHGPKTDVMARVKNPVSKKKPESPSGFGNELIARLEKVKTTQMKMTQINLEDELLEKMVMKHKQEDHSASGTETSDSENDESGSEDGGSEEQDQARSRAMRVWWCTLVVNAILATTYYGISTWIADSSGGRCGHEPRCYAGSSIYARKV